MGPYTEISGKKDREREIRNFTVTSLGIIFFVEVLDFFNFG